MSKTKTLHATDLTRDLTRDLYRTFYIRWLVGERINAVSPDAELVFFRLHFIADPFGNFHASLHRILEDAFRFRPQWATLENLGRWLSELERPTSSDGTALRPLLSRYEGEGLYLYHIHDYVFWQSTPNGKRSHHVHESPWDRRDLERLLATKKNPDKSKKIQVLEEEGELETATAELSLSAAAAEFLKRGMDAESARLLGRGISESDLARAFKAFDNRREKEQIDNPFGLMKTLLKQGCTPPISRRTRGYDATENNKKTTKTIDAIAIVEADNKLRNSR